MFNNIVTKEEYLMIYGKNLDIELPYDDDEANKSERFIFRVESFVKSYLQRYEPQEILDFNLQDYKLAILAQIYHTLQNGFDGVLCDEAKIYLKNGMFLNVRSY